MATKAVDAAARPPVVEGMRFFGDVQTRRCWDDAVLTRLVHPRARHVPKHEHPWPYFALILGGIYEEEGRRGFNQYQGFTLGFHPAYTRHTGIVPACGASFFSVEIGESWLDDFRGPHALNQAVYELHAGEITWLAVKLYREYCAGEDACDLAMESLLWEMLGAAGRVQHLHRHPEPEWWRRAIDLLHDRFRENVRISELAEEAGVHPVYFARAFRRVTGKNPGAYLRNLRVQHACRKLLYREMPLSEIAAEAGFADQSHMTRMFQKLLRATPATIQRALFNRSE